MINNDPLNNWLDWDKTCMSFAMLDFTVIGHEVGRLFMFGWVISFCKFVLHKYISLFVYHTLVYMFITNLFVLQQAKLYFPAT